MFPRLLSYILRQQFNLYINNCDYYITVCFCLQDGEDGKVVMFQPDQCKSHCNGPALVRKRILFQFALKYPNFSNTC